jgi:phosphoglycolate phosphatase
MATILVLFDIDGTLLHSRGAGVRGMNRAFLALHGWSAALDGVPIAGRTDRAIVADVFGRRGVDDSPGRVWALREAYLSALPGELAVAPPASYVLPGVEEALDSLEADTRFTVALLTGNFETGARLKLEAAGVWGRFAFGAYGDHHVNRRDLVPVALSASEAAGHRHDAVVVVGDTPLDVDCARAHGALAVGVATGSYTVEELTEAGADLAVATLDHLRPAAAALMRFVMLKQGEGATPESPDV